MGDAPRDSDDLLTGALDGRLTPAEEERFRLRLRESEEDARTYETLKGLRATLRALGTEPAPSELLAVIARRVREEGFGGGPEGGIPAGPRPSGRWSHLRAMGFARAAAVLVVFVLVGTILVKERGREREVRDEGAPEAVAEGGRESEDGRRERSSPLPARAPTGKAPEATGAPAEQAEGGAEKARRIPLAGEPGPVPDPPSLAVSLDRFGSALGVHPDPGASAFERSIASVDVVDELAFHVARNLRDFSREELKSEGIRAWAADQDRRIEGRGFLAGGANTPGGGGGGTRPRGRRGSPGGAPAPSAAQRTRPAPQADGAPAEPPSRDERSFYALSGRGATEGARRLLEAFGEARELPVRDGLGTDKGRKKMAAEAPPASAGYAIFEIELPGDRADGLVAALEGLPGSTLRTLGRSLLQARNPGGPGKGTPPKEGIPGDDRVRDRWEGEKGRPDAGGGTAEVRTLVIMVLER